MHAKLVAVALALTLIAVIAGIYMIIIEEATKPGTQGTSTSITAGVVIGNWEVTVLNVTESKYLMYGYRCYSASGGEKFAVIRVKVRNVGEETDTFSISHAMLITRGGTSYEPAYWVNLGWKSLDLVEIMNETLAESDEITNPLLGTSASLKPGDYVVGELIFEVPKNEAPQKLLLQIGASRAELVLPNPIPATAKETKIIRAIRSTIGRPVEVGAWRLTVLSINESHIVKAIGYLQAKKGMKFVVVKIRVENIGIERGVPFGADSEIEPGQLSLPVIVTDKGKVFRHHDYWGLIVCASPAPYESIETLSEEIARQAIDIEYFSFKAVYERGEAQEGHIWAVIPEDEAPIKLVTVYVPSLHKPLVRIEIALTCTD